MGGWAGLCLVPASRGSRRRAGTTAATRYAQIRSGLCFVSRRAVKGQILPPAAWRAGGGRDYVLTRILWLEGLEPGVNRGAGIDSRARYIYIHGTNQEQLLGTPASHGCIRMANADVISFFDYAKRHRDLVVEIA